MLETTIFGCSLFRDFSLQVYSRRKIMHEVRVVVPPFKHIASQIWLNSFHKECELERNSDSSYKLVDYSIWIIPLLSRG